MHRAAKKLKEKIWDEGKQGIVSTLALQKCTEGLEMRVMASIANANSWVKDRSNFLKHVYHCIY